MCSSVEVGCFCMLDILGCVDVLLGVCGQMMMVLMWRCCSLKRGGRLVISSVEAGSI